MDPVKARSPTTSNNDPETKSNEDAATIIVHESPAIDIEHMPVADDPRKWSNFRKVCSRDKNSPSRADP